MALVANMLIFICMSQPCKSDVFLFSLVAASPKPIYNAKQMNSITLNKFTLTESSVIDILSQNVSANDPVALVAIDYNWGPPVSGRFDVDFLQIWAAAKTSIGPKTVRLLGNYGVDYPGHTGPSTSRPPDPTYGIWVDDLQFQHVKDCGEHQLYLLLRSGGSAPLLPTPLTYLEFVIKLETTNGQVYYDNNGEFAANYGLKPYLGSGTSAVAGEGAIWNFKDPIPARQRVAREGFVSYRLLKPS